VDSLKDIVDVEITIDKTGGYASVRQWTLRRGPWTPRYLEQRAR
jgi:hypothetical protein